MQQQQQHRPHLLLLLLRVWQVLLVARFGEMQAQAAVYRGRQCPLTAASCWCVLSLWDLGSLSDSVGELW